MTRVGPVLADSDGPTRSAYYQTGSAPLDLVTNTIVDASLKLVLPLTVGLLLIISMAYFRSPLTPLMTFAGLGIALVLALGGTILLAHLFGAVDSTSLTLEEVFVLGVGTDYSIFIVARYREELHRGRTVRRGDRAVPRLGGPIGRDERLDRDHRHPRADLQRGHPPLAVGPRPRARHPVHDPPVAHPGPRRAQTDRAADLLARHRGAVRPSSREGQRPESPRRRTYFYRAGRFTQRRPVAVLGVLLLISIPLILIALQVPLAFDFYGQLPRATRRPTASSRSTRTTGTASRSLRSPCVTFASPLLVGNHTNSTEFTDLAELDLDRGEYVRASRSSNPRSDHTGRPCPNGRTSPRSPRPPNKISSAS